MTTDKSHAHWDQTKHSRSHYTDMHTESHNDINEQLESLLLTQQLGRITDMPRWYEGRHAWNLS